MNELTEMQDSSIFRLVPDYFYPSPLEKDLVQGIFIEMSMDLNVIERHAYTIFEALSDVGGL